MTDCERCDGTCSCRKYFSENTPRPWVMERKSVTYRWTSASGTSAVTILLPPRESIPCTLARLLLRSLITSPMLLSGTVMSINMIGSSSTGLAFATASLKASLAAISNAMGFESTGCSLPSVIDTNIFSMGKPATAPSVNTQADSTKMGPTLTRLCEEDQTLSWRNEPSTKQTILEGMGDQHVDIALKRAEKKFGTSLDISTPKVPYRESITSSGDSQYRHKKTEWWSWSIWRSPYAHRASN